MPPSNSDTAHALYFHDNPIRLTSWWLLPKICSCLYLYWCVFSIELYRFSRLSFNIFYEWIFNNFLDFQSWYYQCSVISILITMSCTCKPFGNIANITNVKNYLLGEPDKSDFEGNELICLSDTKWLIRGR